MIAPPTDTVSSGNRDWPPHMPANLQQLFERTCRIPEALQQMLAENGRCIHFCLYLIPTREVGTVIFVK